MARLDGISNNLSAFLDMLAHSEGTAGRGDDGYNIIVGGSTFHDYGRHPKILVNLPRLGIKSTAAGRYQLLYRYWVAYTQQLGLKGFGPETQDRIAIRQIRERRALADIEAGRFAEAVGKCRNIWASLPGAGYGQHENSMEALELVYVRAGGMAG